MFCKLSTESKAQSA